MSRDAWDEFSKTILARYVLSYLCGTLSSLMQDSHSNLPAIEESTILCSVKQLTIEIFLISEPQVSAEKTLGKTEAAIL